MLYFLLYFTLFSFPYLENNILYIDIKLFISRGDHYSL